MKFQMILGALLATMSLLAVPAGAKVHRASPCRQINEELASGKTADQVAHDLKVSAATVKRCKPSKKASAASSKTAK